MDTLVDERRRAALEWLRRYVPSKAVPKCRKLERLVFERVFLPERLSASSRAKRWNAALSVATDRARWSEYRNRIRSLSYNLRRSEDLSRRFASGDLSEAKLAAMTHAEMRPDLYHNLRTMSLRIIPQEKGTCTLFQCSKCGGRETSYTQQQTRSADEPMTSFILCTNCGHRWKQG